jgi:hypothetical protein
VNPETKSQWKSVGKTGGVVGLAAAIVIGVTQLVLPPAQTVNPRAFKAATEGTSNWDIVYKWSYKDGVQSTQWFFFAYTTNTTKIVIDATNGHRFYTITEYFLTGFPAWMTNSEQFRWRRTN